MNWYKIIKTARLRPHGSLELLKKLKKFKIQYIRPGKGDHQMWGYPGTKIQASIPVSSNCKKVQVGTILHILKDLNISKKEFETGKRDLKPIIDNSPMNNEEEINNEEKIPNWKKQQLYREQEMEQLFREQENSKINNHSTKTEKTIT